MAYMYFFFIKTQPACKLYTAIYIQRHETLKQGGCGPQNALVMVYAHQIVT